MRRIILFSLVVVVVLAFAFTPVASAQGNKVSGKGRVEFGTFLGGVFGKSIGNTDTTCRAGVTLSCDPTADFTPNGIGIIPPPYVSPLADLMTSEGVEPRNGFSYGARLGVYLGGGARWQAEFVYQLSTAGVRFTNDFDRLNLGLDLFCNPDAFSDCSGDRNVRLLDRGGTKGNQQLYLFNLNYHWNENNRIVPYVGGGGGVEKWYNGPKVVVYHTRFGDDDVESKRSGKDKAFAVDFSAGVKIYATEHFGLRAEVMDVISFPRFDHRFDTIDINGFITTTGGSLAPTGTLRQHNSMNQIITSVGIFWRF